MSVDTGISIHLVCSRERAAIIDALLASKWLGRKDGWWCVPLNEDPSEWSLLGRDNQLEVKSLFNAKMAAQQVFGIRLWWEGEEVGGEFLVFPNCELTFSPSINRVTLGDRATDVSWYLARLLPIFRGETGVVVESWTWQETS